MSLVLFIAMILTTLSLLADHNWHPRESTFFLSIAFSFPYVLLMLSYWLQGKLFFKSLKYYRVIIYVFLVLVFISHIMGHSQVGNPWTGVEWLGAYVMVPAGIAISILFLIFSWIYTIYARK